jgi:dihydrofolate reductase
LAALKAGPGKDIWLFGGGSLFGRLAEDGLVDAVEVRIVPVLLAAGVPLLPSLAKRIRLSLTAHRVYRTGRISLEYAIR